MSSLSNSANLPQHPTLSSILLDGARQMDPSSWARLVTTFGPVVYGWCRAAGISESDAPDIVQDVFVTVARGIPSFQRQKPAGSFRSWLATITRSRLTDFLRKQSREPRAAGGSDALESQRQWVDPAADDIASTVDSAVDVGAAKHAVEQQMLRDIAAEFENKTWQAFWLTTVDAKTAAEAARATGISVASVYQAKSRVLRRLRQRLAELPE